MKEVKIVVQKHWSGSTLQHLFREIWQVPKKLTHELRMNNAVKVNREVNNWTCPLYDGDILEISLSGEHKKYKNYQQYIDILYEDEHLIIVNKPANMQTHPNTDETNTLMNAVATRFDAKEENYSFHPIHRLDKDTTGAILVAKNTLSLVILNKMLEERKIKRTYWALADGIIQKNSGRIEQPIGRDRHHATRRRVSNTGQIAITNYRVLKRLPNKKLTLIECHLDTGRTHQIRVHLQHLGYPLAGDKLYGGSNKFQRQALHARQIEFIHPFTLEAITVEAPFLDAPPIFTNI